MTKVGTYISGDLPFEDLQLPGKAGKAVLIRYILALSVKNSAGLDHIQISSRRGIIFFGAVSHFQPMAFPQLALGNGIMLQIVFFEALSVVVLCGTIG